MKPIIQLDQILINKIAAGEVVERPLSVVKELTENSIDAGATVITVEIADGGLTSVRVTDNGGGIAADELKLAFSRHATSKIASIDDLFEVQTLGFRGEALSSISAVSQVEMITKTAHAITGTKVEVHGGKILSRQNIGCANGTTIVVANLFYNTPARRKFLKKPATEAGYISDCLQRLALGNPGLTLRYINNGKIVFQSTGNGDLKNAMLNIYGREVATNVVPVDVRVGELYLHGLVGKPDSARSNRRYGTFFINGRYIQSELLTKAIETAFSQLLPGGKFPLFVLNLKLPFDSLDVNVHPTKMDVRFAEEERIFEFVEGAVRDALEGSNLIPAGRPRSRGKVAEVEVEQLSIDITDNDERQRHSGRQSSPGRQSLPSRQSLQHRQIADPANTETGVPSTTGQRIAMDAWTSSLQRTKHASAAQSGVRDSNVGTDIESTIRDLYLNPGCMGEQFDLRTANPTKAISAKEYNSIPRADVVSPKMPPHVGNTTQDNSLTYDNSFAHDTPPQPRNDMHDAQIIGLVFNTYWLISQSESLYVIDQHAAHERVLYENILTKFRESTIPSQQLLLPIPLHLTPREKQTLTDNIDLFQKFGFTIAHEGDSFAIEAVPLLINGPLSSAFFSDILDKIDQPDFSKKSPYDHKTELVAMAACKASVKGGDSLSETEARALIAQLLELENPFTCPHGRPTIIEITRKELEKRFMR